jgi:predicted dehydrogenase
MKQAMSKPGVKAVAICDVDSERREKAAQVVGRGCAKDAAFRELLARDDLDAVTHLVKEGLL